MKILHLSLSYIPSERASGVQVMKMCSALARQGHEVTLVSKLCPERQLAEVADDHAYYGVAPNFEIVKLPRPARSGGGLVHALAVWRFLRSRRGERDTLVYGRDVVGSWLAARLGFPLVFELHGPPTGFSGRRLWPAIADYDRLDRVVAISKRLASRLRESGQVRDRTDVVVAHDAGELPVGRASVADDSGPTEVGRRLQVGYVGSLHPGKGVDMILRLADTAREYDFHVVGGRRRGPSTEARESPANLHFHGHRAPAELDACYGRFDVLLMPYRKDVRGATGSTNLAQWMSPLKMFDYMAQGKAIVSSDLPVIREVLQHERNALLAPPDDLDAWHAALRRLETDAELRLRLGTTARDDLLNEYTWDIRAQRVLEGL